jgi:excisionase family DNA binding protein
MKTETTPLPLDPKWYTVAQVARLLGYGETKVRTLIISGDLRSLKDGRARRGLPEWVDDYIQESVQPRRQLHLMARRHNGEGSIYP